MIWTTIRQYLRSNGTWRHELDLCLSTLSDDLRSLVPVVKTFEQVKSVDTPFCQLADLFAGMAAYTRTNSEIVKRLIRSTPEQRDLFGTPEDSQAKRRDRVRFRVIEHLNQQCKLRQLGVSLREHGYFRTHNPRQPLNFWHYEPQHSLDRAPSKVSVAAFQGTIQGEVTQ